MGNFIEMFTHKIRTKFINILTYAILELLFNTIIHVASWIHAHKCTNTIIILNILLYIHEFKLFIQQHKY